MTANPSTILAVLVLLAAAVAAVALLGGLGQPYQGVVILAALGLGALQSVSVLRGRRPEPPADESARQS